MLIDSEKLNERINNKSLAAYEECRNKYSKNPHVTIDLVVWAECVDWILKQIEEVSDNG